MTETYRAPVVGKAFSILGILSRASGPLSLSEIAKASGIGKSTVLGIVAALEATGAVERDATSRKVGLGLTLLELGRAVHARLDLTEAARPVLEELRERTSESVFLGVRSGDHVTIVDVLESVRDLKITSPVGTRIPLLAGATGRAFLASMPEEEARALVASTGLRPFTDRTIVDPERYLSTLEAVRRDGWAFDDEEYIPGVRAVAARIRDGGRRSAAVWVVGFKPGMDDAKTAAVARATCDAADAIARRLSP